jgi:serine/threonine protein kinase/Tfp pilus assembly protein PilF
MQSTAPEISNCPGCGRALKETSGGGLGCMVCLLRVGIGDDDTGVTLESFRERERFGVYELEHREDGTLYELGRGAIGVTYSAIDTTLQRKVALKIINVDIAGRSAEARERFLREARAAAALRHENIATVFQFGINEETGHLFYAMELIEGETLEERVRRTGPLDVRTAINVAQQVAAALVAAEKRGLIHRDLKPANLMLLEPDEPDAVGRDRRARRQQTAHHATPTVKIIDFGLAKALNAPGDSTRLTHHGFVGTPAFASPEQFENSALDVRSDIYSLGVTLWFALTGDTPFGGHNVKEIQHAQRSTALPIEQLKAARVPSGLRSLIKSMLAFEAAARPDTRLLTVKLQRCAAQASSLGRARIALAAATAILIISASAFFTFYSLRTHPTTNGSASIPAISEKSIAVLPFENLSRDPDSVVFADGVQDDVLTKLAKIADLKVISRTSVMQYRGKYDLREIGRALGVSHLLEGTVRRSEGKVHVNAQLIDTRTDTHVWAEEYDRNLNDVFAVESELAQSIANQLRAKVSARENLAMQERPTSDLIAFGFYTRAKSLVLAAASRSTGRTDLLEAVDLLNQAVARDPSFLQAYCLLASAHGHLYSLNLDHTSTRLASAEAAIQTAFRLRPDAGEAHFARAENLYRGYQDYRGALGELEIAGQTLPNDMRVFQLMGYIQRRQGRWEEATRNLERAVTVDPANTHTLLQMAWHYLFVRRYAEVKPLLARALAIEPNRVDMEVLLASVDFHWKADIRPFHQMIDSIQSTNPPALPAIADAWLTCALAERDPGGAANAMVAVGENAFGEDTVQFSRTFVEGLVARMMKDEAKARAAFTAARSEQEKIVRAQPNYGPPLCVLGLIDAALGQKEEAMDEGRRAIELLPLEKDAINGVRMIKYLAMIAAWAGDKDLACDQLATIVRYPTSPSYGELKLLPFWDPLRGDPRFEQIVTSVAPK